jgi:AraC-like DNA-binding protein
MINVKNITIRKELSKYIRKISIFQSEDTHGFKHKLTPSAFTYLSYNHGDIPISFFGGKKVHPSGRLQIAGPKINENIQVEYIGSLSQILVEFTASGFYYLFHKSPYDLTNKLSEVSNFISKELYNNLETNLVKYDDPIDQVNIIERILLELSYKALPFIDYIEESIKLIDKHFGNITVSDVVTKIRRGKRQFDRKFHDVVGVSPKYYAKIVQLYHVLNVICSKNYSSIQELAFKGEFYDLPHFVNAFKKLTGFTPSEFIKSDKHIALKYFNEI